MTLTLAQAQLRTRLHFATITIARQSALKATNRRLQAQGLKINHFPCASYGPGQTPTGFAHQLEGDMVFATAGFALLRKDGRRFVLVPASLAAPKAANAALVHTP